jgi:hypothetical protein
MSNLPAAIILALFVVFVYEAGQKNDPTPIQKEECL